MTILAVLTCILTIGVPVLVLAWLMFKPKVYEQDDTTAFYGEDIHVMGKDRENGHKKESA